MPKFEEEVKKRHRGFKTWIPVDERQIVTPIYITEAHKEGEEYKVFEGPWKALWDTGATSSTISKSLAAQLQLPVLSECTVHGVGGEYQTREYLAGLILPNSVPIPSTSLFGCEAADDFDMLLGMDIISMGDFLISVESGNMYFSFQVPSFGGFYLDDIQLANLQNGRIFQRSQTLLYPRAKIKRNDPCPCGSGKKYKKCCGRNS